MADRVKPDFFLDPTDLADTSRWYASNSVWNRAALSTRQADPFCCLTYWQLAFHDAFSPKRNLLVRESADSVIAFAEKIFSETDIYLTPIEPMWFFGSPLLGRHAVALLGDSMGDLEQHYGKHFPRLLISGIAPNGSVYQQLRQRFDRRFRFSLLQSKVQCAASLAGGFNGYWSRRSANLRKNMKKALRQAWAKNLTFERHTPGSRQEAESLYSRMLAVELASWKGKGRCGMAESPCREYYGLMLERLAHSRSARLMFAIHEGKDIGFIFGGMAGTIYRGQQFSFDDDWRDTSIGNLLQHEQIRWLCEEKATRYDMGPLLGYKMGYKAHWTERKFHIETWCLTDQ